MTAEDDRDRAIGRCRSQVGQPRIGDRARVEQLLETNPDTVAVACPYCMTMVDDGIKAKGMEPGAP